MKKIKAPAKKNFRKASGGNFRVKPCYFCGEKKDPDYKEVELIKRYVSERGKIVSRTRSGICRKHQMRLAQAIKRARFLSLLPFVSRIK